MSKYTAVTIGPIYKTMSVARKTRHLWGASFLFSYIMKGLLEYLLEKERDQPSKILLPSVNALHSAPSISLGAGLYPDRLIVQDDDGNIHKSLKEVVGRILDRLSRLFQDPDIKTFFFNYIRVYSVHYDVSEQIEGNIVGLGNKLLDSTELKEKYYNDITQIDWQSIIDKLNGQIFYREALGNVKTNYQFPSIVEIATDDFRQKNNQGYEKLIDDYLQEHDEASQENFLNALNQNADILFKGLTIQPYHKYMAVIQADGDNIGKTIAAIDKDPTTVKVFSSALFQFAQSATKEISQYGGKPVYVGGDDLFFFAPVAISNNDNDGGPTIRTVFSLLHKIDIQFQEKILNNPALSELYKEGELIKPSLSYGVSIIYSKYPLNEARDISFNLLKKIKDRPDNDKNKINFKVLKHSGQGFGFIIDKNKSSQISPQSFDYFHSLCSAIPVDAPLLRSLIYKLAPLHNVIKSIGGDKQRMENFFENTFNEEYHSSSGIKGFLNNTRNYISQVYEDFPNDIESIAEYETEERNGNLSKIYSTLRFFKFLLNDE